MASPEAAAERRKSIDLNLRAVLWTAGGTASFLLVSLAGLYLIWQAADGPRDFPLPQGYGPPDLQSDPAGDLRRFTAGQRAALEDYAWVDRERGIVRIPVEHAMEILASRGAAAWAPLPPPAANEASR
ncbi:hypothetical protein [Falsiroseomonas sp. HW251]|uniref:hypothetical protein n=1 Tax=Falsiroseomonas sp. HW251 TaxID=3390998 RepID=UPI003D3145FB